MAKSVSVIGIDPGELRWVRMLLFLLRHPDPLMPEMARQALLYLANNGHAHTEPAAESIDQAG